MTLEQRIKLRLVAYHVGLMFVAIGILTLFLVGILVMFNVNLKRPTEMLMISLSVVVYGVSLSMVFSQLGWNKSLLIDIILNQSGVLITTIGYLGLCIHFFQGKTNQLALLYLGITFLGLSLVGMGIKYSTYS